MDTSIVLARILTFFPHCTIHLSEWKGWSWGLGVDFGFGRFKEGRVQQLCVCARECTHMRMFGLWLVLVGLGGLFQ
jgi:hypothetical protein